MPSNHFEDFRFDPARHDTLGRSVNSLAKSNLMQLIGETFWLISHCDPSWDEVSWTSTHEISIRWLHQAALSYTITTQRYVLTNFFLVKIHTTEDLECKWSCWKIFPVNMHPLFLYWKHGSVCEKICVTKKLDYCYSKREEVRLWSFTPCFLQPIFWTF